ncbi:Shikimate kinase [Rothia dentocariosa]|uniref:Shikimate kinase n=1 Tax=Rothia dentocariosa TaxID=2047 RepID=A0A3S5C0U1_9MICC|nr:Shikimate kinase [Rothia dentocariosa]
MAAEDPAPSGRASSETNPFSRIAEAARRAREGNASRPQSKLSEPEENTAEQHEVGSHTQELHSARKAAVPNPLTVFGKFGKAAPRAASKVRVYASSDSDTPAPLASNVFREKLAGFTVEPHKPQDEQGSPQVPEESEVLETSKAARGQQSDTIPTPAIFARPRVVAEQASRKNDDLERTPVSEQPHESASFAAITARMARAAHLRHGVASLESERESISKEKSEENTLRIHPQQVRELQEEFAERARPVVLIGPMAAGKTYIGTHFARFYGYEFLDADQLIVERYGEVSEIFEIFGEAYFRELERKTIEDVLTSPTYRNTVFSLGGGAPMTDAVADLLRDECVVYILVDVDTVEPRITGNKTRPLLEPNPVERWSEIFEHRQHRYEELAQHTLDARGEKNISVMTAEIQNFVLAFRKEHSHD